MMRSECCGSLRSAEPRVSALCESSKHYKRAQQSPVLCTTARSLGHCGFNAVEGGDRESRNGSSLEDLSSKRSLLWVLSITALTCLRRGNGVRTVIVAHPRTRRGLGAAPTVTPAPQGNEHEERPRHVRGRRRSRRLGLSCESSIRAEPVCDVVRCVSPAMKC